MESDDKRRIQLNTTQLADDLDPSDVIPDLIQDGIFTFDDRERILNQVTGKDRTLKLLELLLKKGPDAYNSFHRALIPNQSFLADLLDKTELKGEVTATVYSERSNEIREELADHYQRSLQSISPLQWCEWFQLDFESVFTDVQLIRADRKKAGTKRAHRESRNGCYFTKLEELFNPHREGSSPPNRILVEGEPGIGKTTMCQKIAFDWSKSQGETGASANGQTRPEYLEQFQMLFYLHARDIQSSLIDSIYEHVLPEDFSCGKEELQKYIEEHQKHTLFIIDGFDEVSNKGNPVLHKLMQRRILPHCMVLLTSRPRYALPFVRFFDASFVLLGYSEDRMDDFIQKYSHDMGVPLETFDGLQQRKNSYTPMNELCRNPLNLCFLCILCEERGELPYTRTEIYDEIVDMLMKKAETRLGIPMEKLREHLAQLCKLAYDGLQNNVYSFPAHQFTCEKVLSSMGFLNKELPMSRLHNSVVYYAFTHKSFQEYLGARHVSSLPKEERAICLENHLRSKYMPAMWVFFCGMNRQNDAILLQFFTAFQQQFYPTTRHCFSPVENTGIVHKPKSIPFHALSIQDLSGGLHILFFKCLKELDLESLSSKVLDIIAKIIPSQITFSYPFSSKTALTGFLNYLKSVKSTQKFQLILSSQLFDDQEENMKLLDLLREIGKTGQIDSLGLHMVTSIAELKTAFEAFGLNEVYSTIKCLQLKFISVVSGSEQEIEELRIGHGLEIVEILDCNSWVLLAKLLDQVSLNVSSLKKLEISHSSLDSECVLKINRIIKQAEKLINLDLNFLGVHMPDESKLTALPFLAALESRNPTIKYLSLSGLHSVHSWQTNSPVSTHVANYFQSILLKNKLEHLNIYKTVLPRTLIESIIALVQKGLLKSLQIEYCVITCAGVFNRLLEELETLPELRRLSIKGSTIRALPQDSETTSSGTALVPEINSLTTQFLQLSPRPVHKTPPTSPKAPSPSPNRLIRSRCGSSPPTKFKFGQVPVLRGLSVPDGMIDKVRMSIENNARSDERSESINILRHLVEKTTSLTSLEVSDLHADQLVCLCNGLKNNKTLLSVSLRHTNFTRGCTGALCAFFEQHPCIEEFSMSKSNMNFIEAEPFFEALSKCKSLRTLGLNYCLFHDKHMTLLAKTLKENLSIDNAILRDNSKVSSSGIEVLYEELKGRPKRLKTLDLSDCKIKKDDKVAEQLKEVALVIKINWF